MARKKLLLVGWDSADWKIMRPLISAGQMPGIAALLKNGVGGNMTTLEPQLSPMLWTSVATGKMAYHHGVLGFTEVDPVTRSVVPVSAATRRCRTLWEILGECGLRSHVVGWFATQGERNLHGKMVSNMFGHLGAVRADEDPATWPEPPPGTYWPPDLAAEMNLLRVSPHEVDPDQIIRLFVPDAPAIDQEKDRRLWHLAERLAESFSVHSAVTHVMESDPDWDFLAVYYRAIDEISHAFMPYHPPRLEGIPEEDFNLYSGVVDSTYRLHDMFLQRLLQLAGPDTAVVLISDHGFHSDHLRPRFTPRVPAGITVWHRSQGVVIASGPGLKQDETIHGARLLDVTPTVLHYFGLPVGADMEGRVLEEAFAKPTPPTLKATWEPADGLNRERVRMKGAGSQALLDQFVALGYIDELAADPAEAAVETERENRWNLARACIYGRRLAEALPMLENICHAAPTRADYAQVLANCQLQLGLAAEAEVTMTRMLEKSGKSNGRELLESSVAIQRGNYPDAIRVLESLRHKDPEGIQVHQLLSQCYLRVRRWEDAETSARKVIGKDPANAEAFLILARLQLHLERPAEAVDSALEAIDLHYGNAHGHFLLGAALAQLGEWKQAERPLFNAIQLAPKMLRIYRTLARVYRALGESAKAEACRTQSRMILDMDRREATAKFTALRKGISERAAVRAREDAIRTEAAEQRAAEEAKIEPIDFVIVSGLPRSGTSLMMQMLRAAGMEPMTDEKRSADEDNQEGYWEWEAIKQLPRNPRILEEAKGKVVKIISALLPSLPAKHRYKIIYMKRPVAQVVDSQRTMLQRHGRNPALAREKLIEVEQRHSDAMLEFLEKRESVELLQIDYPDLVANPQAVVDGLAAFLGTQFHPDSQVAACVKPGLYRNRSL